MSRAAQDLGNESPVAASHVEHGAPGRRFCNLIDEEATAEFGYLLEAPRNGRLLARITAALARCRISRIVAAVTNGQFLIAGHRIQVAHRAVSTLNHSPGLVRGARQI